MAFKTEVPSPSLPGNTNEKRLPRDDDPNRDALEDIQKCVATGEISEYAVTIEGEERTTWFVWLLVCCCTISGLLFGESFTDGFGDLYSCIPVN